MHQAAFNSGALYGLYVVQTSKENKKGNKNKSESIPC